MTERLWERIRWLAILGMLAWLPLAFWTGFNDCFPLTKWLLLLLLGTFAIMLNRRPFPGGSLAWVPFWLGACCLAAFLGAVRGAPWRSVPEAGLLALPVLAATGGIQASRLAAARAACIGAAVLVAGLGLWQFAGGEDPGAWISPFSKGVASTIGNPDLLGGFLVFPFALALAPAIVSRPGWFWKLGAALLGAGILATEARAAWLAAGVAGLWLVRRPSRRIAVAGLAVGILAVWLAASPELRARFMSGSALAERLWTWDISARLVRACPLAGHGAGNFRRAYLAEQAAARARDETYYHYTEYAHMEPLHFCVEMGAIGLGLLLWGVAACFARWRTSRLRYSHPALWRGIGAGAAGVLVNSLLSFPLHVSPTAAVFWIMLCAGTAESRPRPGLVPGELRSWIIWPAAALLLASGLRLAYHGVALRLGQIQAQAGLFRQATRNLAAAGRLAPGDAHLYWHAGATARRQGELEAANVWLDRGLELEPDLPELNLESGLTLKGLGQLHAAEAAYRSALRSNPLLAEAWNNLGNLLGEQGRLAEAEAAQRRAIALAPELRQARQNLAVTLMRLGRRDEGLRILEGGK